MRRALFALALILTACGDDDPAPPVPPEGAIDPTDSAAVAALREWDAAVDEWNTLVEEGTTGEYGTYDEWAAGNGRPLTYEEVLAKHQR